MFDEIWTEKWNYKIDVTIKTMKVGTISTQVFVGELVQLCAVCTKPPDQSIYIVTELMCNEILLDYLCYEPGQELELSTLVDIAAQIIIISILKID
ncbi:unnamed protein product [Rotaria sordida]|uniref:Uncharacterized protein n=1 Tax=Rotaria sordida TaxID=392033 RepID=A0A814PPT2_9BILA|nr:unnamed protein product [Rotaria sordida]CAF1319938.1 unnamed protein product [Rotaria sordida]